MTLPFQGIPTFLKSKTQKANFEFLGLPFDSASSFRPGAALAANAIRMASMMLTDGDHPEFGIDPSTVVCDRGDATINSGNILCALNQIETAVDSIEGVGLFAGGNHLVTLPILRSLHKRHKISLIHLDAHCDTWSSHFGDKYGHGTFLYNVIEEGLVDPKNVYQIGLRSPVDKKTQEWLPDLGGHVYNMRDLRKGHTDYALLAKIISNKLRHERVYLTVDIDVLDPSCAPGTGTPEIGGMMTGDIIDFIEGLECDFIGMDVVEVNPMLDPQQITALAAATIFWSFVAKNHWKLIS